MRQTIGMVALRLRHVSTTDQNLDLALQEAALDRRLPGNSRREEGGTRRGGRSEPDTLPQFLRAGGTLVITRIDHLARSLKDIQHIVHELKEKGVTLKATGQPVDTSAAAGKSLFDMLGIFVQVGTNLRRERQMEGTAAARVRGLYEGRRPKIGPDEMRRLHAKERLSPTVIARRLGIARSSVYRFLPATDQAGAQEDLGSGHQSATAPK